MLRDSSFSAVARNGRRLEMMRSGGRAVERRCGGPER